MEWREWPTHRAKAREKRARRARVVGALAQQQRKAETRKATR